MIITQFLYLWVSSKEESFKSNLPHEDDTIAKFSCYFLTAIFHVDSSFRGTKM